jgi:hypothetical protein
LTAIGFTKTRWSLRLTALSRLSPPSDLQKSVKSRGAPHSIIGDAAPRFNKAFDDLFEVMGQPGAMEAVLKEGLIPSVPVTVRVFYGHRLALARSKPYLAGKWEDVPRHVSFEWSTKRDRMRVVLSDGYIVTFPIAQSILAESEGYKEADFDRLVEISGEKRHRRANRRKYAARGDAGFHTLSAT